MATVYRATVTGSHWNGWDIYYEQGESIVLEGQQYVRSQYGGALHVFDDRWHYRKADAARSCMPELEKWAKQLEQLIQSITADTGRSCCDSSATV